MTPYCRWLQLWTQQNLLGGYHHVSGALVYSVGPGAWRGKLGTRSVGPFGTAEKAMEAMVDG